MRNYNKTEVKLQPHIEYIRKLNPYKTMFLKKNNNKKRITTPPPKRERVAFYWFNNRSVHNAPKPTD